MRNKVLIALAVAIVFTSSLLLAVLNGRGQLVTNELLDNPQGIALMVHDGTQYNKATSVSNSFKYVLNRTLTKCEGGGAVVSYNRSTGVIEYSLPTADMCYVYLDLDTTPPTVTSLVLNSGETYSTTKAVPAVLTFPLPEDDWDGYCLTLDSDGSDCTSGNKWQTLGTSPMSLTFNFTVDGDQTVYAFIKDIAGNLSAAISDSIIVDTTPPSIPTYSAYYASGGAAYTSGTWTNALVYTDISSSDALSGLNRIEYRWSTSTTWTTLGFEISALQNGKGTESWTLQNRDQIAYFRACDNLDNCSNESAAFNIKYDVDTPSLTSAARSGYNYVAFTTSDTGGSASLKYCINTSSTGSGCSWTDTTAGTITTTDIIHVGGTYYVHVKDGAGNVGHSSSFTMPYTLGGYLMTNAPEGFKNTALAGELYRFRGTASDKIYNHVCFGTTDKSTCTGNTDVYMYRIIGMQSDYQVKLIKKEAINDEQKWNGDNLVNTWWENCRPYAQISGSAYLGNSTYMPAEWKVLLSSHKFYTMNDSDFKATASTAKVYAAESESGTYTSTVGLMYIHDYLYAYNADVSCGEEQDYSTCRSSWIHLANNDSAPMRSYEWTMSRAESIAELVGWLEWDDVHYAYSIAGDGYVAGEKYDEINTYRPVIYLRAGTQFVSGSGTAADPFIIRTD